MNTLVTNLLDGISIETRRVANPIVFVMRVKKVGHALVPGESRDSPALYGTLSLVIASFQGGDKLGAHASAHHRISRNAAAVSTPRVSVIPTGLSCVDVG